MSQRQPQPKGNYAFIDSQNLNLGTQKVGWKMNWQKFRHFLRDRYNIQKAFLFIGYLPGNEELYTGLHDQGYLIVLKPTLEMYHPPAGGRSETKPAPAKGEEDAKPAVKGNVDAELVLYAVKEMPNYQKAIVVSGDGDFFSLVEYLSQQNKLLHLMTPNWQYSSLLKPFEKYIVRVDQFKRELRYVDRPGHKSKAAKP